MMQALQMKDWLTQQMEEKAMKKQMAGAEKKLIPLKITFQIGNMKSKQ